MDSSTLHRRGAAAAALAATAYLVLAGIHILNPMFDAEFTSPLDYANEVTFALALLGSALGMAALARVGLVPQRSGIVAAVGYALVLAGIVPGLFIGRAPDWLSRSACPATC